MDRLDAMSAFVTVADLRGFAPAARRLGLAPSTVTRLVAALEDRLSIRLLQRTTRAVKLTDAGARYLERARRILADVHDAEGAAQAAQREPIGRIVLAAPSVFGRLQVAPLVSAFLARHPALRAELTLADRVVNLVDEGVDAAVRIGALADSGLVARRLGSTRRVLVASPAYLAAHPRPRAPADLASHALIQFTGLGAAPEWRFERGGRPRVVPLAPRLATNSADAAIALAESGGGVALVLAYQVAEAVRAGTLKVLLAQYEPAPVPIQVVYPSTRLLSAAVRAFVDYAAANARWHFVDLRSHPG